MTKRRHLRHTEPMRKIFALAALTVTLAGCGGANAANKPGDMDAAFLSGISVDRPNTSDAALIKTGHLTCKLLTQDVNDGDADQAWLIELSAMKGSGSLTARQAGVMIASAVTAYCPQHKDLLPTQ
jgi:hypothetical protein